MSAGALAKGILGFLCLVIVSCSMPEGVQNIDAGELRDLIAAEPRLLIIDNRTAGEYAMGRIPGALNITEERFAAIDGFLPRAKDTPLVFYCGGYG